MLPGVRDLRERLDAAVKTSAWSAVAGAAALTMLGFLCAALFLYLQNWRGPIVACLILAGAFLVVVLIAIAAVALVRQRVFSRSMSVSSAIGSRRPTVRLSGIDSEIASITRMPSCSM